MTSKLLVYVPTHSDTAQPESIERAVSLQFGGTVKLLIVDGAKYPTWPKDKAGNLLAQQRLAWSAALAEGCDALLMIEHDMLVPHDVAQAMFDTGLPVVYAPYMLRHGMRRLSLLRYENDRNPGQSLTEYPAELRRARQAGVWRVSGVGWGCTMVRREVLQQVQPRQENDSGYSDMPFATDCLRSNIPLHGLLTHPCKHYDPMSASWLTAWPEKGDNMKVNVLENVITNVYGRSVQLVKGSQADLPAEFVDGLVRTGYVEVVAPEAEAPKATKTVAKRKRGS